MFKVERIVGGTEIQKRQVFETLADRFGSQDHEALAGIVVEKSPEILKAISVADRETSNVLKKYGIEAESVDSSRVHIIRHDAWPSDDGAQFIFNHQCILMPEGENHMKQAYRLAHEFFHFKSYLAGQVLDDERMDYRVGLTVETRDGEQTNLTPLNEAITEILAIEAFESGVFQTEYAEEIQKSKAVMEQNPEMLNEDGGPLFTDQTFFAELGPELPDGSHDIFTSQFTYQSERQGLQLLLEMLFKRNSAEFNTIEDIKKLFVTSAFSGDLLRIGRLTETSFGKGSFRMMAEAQSGEEFLKTIHSFVDKKQQNPK